jgi:uncharacterized protein (DUF4415 family)
MARRGDITRLTAEDIKARLALGEDRTDWKKVDATTGAEIEASIAADPDEMQDEPDWTRAVMGIPARKEHINIRVDHDVLDWFRAQGKGYQTMMNNVLRAFMQTRRQTEQIRPATERAGRSKGVDGRACVEIVKPRA